MKGRRLPDNDRSPMQPGDYKKSNGLWICKPPIGEAGHLGRHEVTEHEDGTISASPSILTSSWHGFLEHGVWREA